MIAQVKNPDDQKAADTQQSATAPQKHYQHTEIKGRFNQYTSGFWAMAVPALMARYVGRFAEGLINPQKLSDVEKKAGIAPRKNILPQNFYPIAAGLWMESVVLYYALRTAGDMKRVFSETLGYEFDKKPEDVGIRDFFNSKNAIVHRTLWNFLKYNARRAGVISTFFAFLLPGPFRKPNADAVDLGVGATGIYLSHDVFTRKVTFFEALQNFIDQKINHKDYMGQPITDNDLISLYAIHTRDNNESHSTAVKMDTMAWKNDEVIFGRMAELMNKTYGNTRDDEKANFTVPKLIYLLGNGFIKVENTKQSLVYVEIANKYGIPAVKQVKREVDKGVDFGLAAAWFPVATQTVRTGSAALTEQGLANIKNQGGEGPSTAEAAEKMGGGRINTHLGRLGQQRQTDELKTEIRAI